MILDAHELGDGSEISADICIIGAGAAGITIAREFISKNVQVVLLESGGLESDPATQSLYAGENIGLTYESLDQSRSRYFGGSTNCWGGWCRPLDPLDFEKRPWIENSGWPITYEQMLPWYVRSHPLLQLGEYNYDLDDWSDRLACDGMSAFPLYGGVVNNIISQFSPPARFGALYRADLAQAANVKALLYANVTEIKSDPDAHRIESVRIMTLGGDRLEVFAKQFVLAAGGIENARLLLCSNAVETAGLGNRRGLVGRYFMDHPRIESYAVRLIDQDRHRDLYDTTMSTAKQIMGGNEGRIAVHVAPSPLLQRTRSLPNARTYLAARYACDMSDAYLALKELRRLWRARTRFGYPLSDFAKEALSAAPRLVNAPQALIGFLDLRLNPKFVRRTFRLQTIIEPLPNPESRVTLSPKRDRLGQPQAVVDWRLTERDRFHFETINDLMIRELAAQGAVVPVDDRRGSLDFWSERILGCWHHMGTTRMSSDPASGVVDADCRVHDYANFYIAGSSVFPTVGSDMPTLTIVALALRLSERLRQAITA